MKKLFFAAAVFATVAMYSCVTSEIGSDVVVEGKPTTMAISIIGATPTKASLVDEAPETGESDYSGNALVVIFNNANQLETWSSAPASGGYSTVVNTTTGLKRVYVLLNIPSTATITTTAGLSRAAFEKELNALTSAQIATVPSFFLTNVATPAQVILEQNVTDPLTELKNIVKVNVGRVAAKVRVEFNAPLANQDKGSLTNIEYKVKNVISRTQTIGYWNAGILETAFFNDVPTGLPAPNPVYDFSNYTTELPGGGTPWAAVEDNINNVAVGSSPKQYPLENTNAVPREGNTTRVVVKAQFHPYVWTDGTDGSSGATPSGDGSIWLVQDYNGLVKGYANSDPIGQGWLVTTVGQEDVVTPYPQGICYYNKVWIADMSEAGATMRYATIRNHSYRVNITSVSGIGDSLEDGDIDVDKPIVEETNMVAEITVLQWSFINLDTGLEGI